MEYGAQGWNLLAATADNIHFLSFSGYSSVYKSHYAIGSGGPYALGFMDAALCVLGGPVKTLEEATIIARGAVKCAIKRDAACGGKIRVVTL